MRNSNYVAPEILRCMTGKEETYNAINADAWSLGVNLFIILSGYPPFGDTKQIRRSCSSRHGRNDWSFDQTCWKDISVDAKSLIKGLMEPDVEKRYTVKQALQHKWCAETAVIKLCPRRSQIYQSLRTGSKKQGLAVLFKTRLTRLVAGLKNTGKRFIESPRGHP